MTYKEFLNLKRGNIVFVDGRFDKVIRIEDNTTENRVNYKKEGKIILDETWSRSFEDVLLTTDNEGITAYFTEQVDKQKETISNIIDVAIPRINKRKDFYLKYNSIEEYQADKVEAILNADSKTAVVDVLKTLNLSTRSQNELIDGDSDFDYECRISDTKERY